MTLNAMSQQKLQQFPKKWAVAIVAALIVYALVQPFANSRFGWQLPSLVGAAANKSVEPNVRIESGSPTNVQNDETVAGSNVSNTTEPKTVDPKQAQSDVSRDLRYGLLKNTGREVYLSPAGLRYTRGSEEGHRLKHLEKHLKDIPDRPGKHGVFDGDMAQVLLWVDDAYTRGKQGARGVRKRDEDGRTVYEVPFTKKIGYIGGRDGKRDNNPDTKRLRLVVEGDQVITAFPY